MKLSFDEEADALYVEIAKGKFHTNKKIDENTVLDLDSKGRVLGFEIIGVREKIKNRDILNLIIQVQHKKSIEPFIKSLKIPLTA